MATIELPEIGGKEFWRNSRLLLWSFIVTMAALQATGLTIVVELAGALVTTSAWIAGVVLT